MQVEASKKLSILLAKRTKWRETYVQTNRSVEAASNRIRGGGRHPKHDVTQPEWLKLIHANGQAFTELGDVEREIAELGAEILKEKPIYRLAVDRLLGYRFDEDRTPWNGVSLLIDSSPAGGGRVSVLPHQSAGAYVKERGAVIVRSISAYSSSDVLLRSGFHPSVFTTEPPNEYSVPAMLWELSTGEWIGVDDVSVGYVGSRPSDARAALGQAGVSEENAARIVEHRFCDVQELDSAQPRWETSTIWPVEPRTAPEMRENRILVIHCGDRLDNISHEYPDLQLRNITDPDPSGFYSTTPSQEPVAAWLEFLDQPQEDLPYWARGNRKITLFFDDQTATAKGYVVEAEDWGYSSGNTSEPSIVISQGEVEIWGHYERPDKLRPMHPDVQELAEAAGYTQKVPYLSSDSFTVGERLSRIFTPEKRRTGCYKTAISTR